MTTPNDDPLWPEFVPVWTAMCTGQAPLVLAGGYGLFLKQRWVRTRGVTTAVPLRDWLDPSARATKDLDIIVSADVLADPRRQEDIGRALRHCGFQVREPRWQFSKGLVGHRTVEIDLHAAAPVIATSPLVSDRMRVKNPAARGQYRIHGRTNPESFGAEKHPSIIVCDGVEISLPHPLVWAVMKVTAAGERLVNAQDPQLTVHQRATESAQADKHAFDAGRVVALMHRDERDKMEQVRAWVRASPAYDRACAMRREHFAGDGFARAILAQTWTARDVGVILDQLADWLP